MPESIAPQAFALTHFSLLCAYHLRKVRKTPEEGGNPVSPDDRFSKAYSGGENRDIITVTKRGGGDGVYGVFGRDGGVSVGSGVQ